MEYAEVLVSFTYTYWLESPVFLKVVV